MNSPLLIIAAALGGAFSLGIVKKLGKEISFAFTLLTLSVMALISAWWVSGFIHGNLAGQVVSTAGGKAPFVIVLHMGLSEALFTLMVNVMGILGAFYLHDRFAESGYAAMATYIAAIMGMNGIILTGDIFNLFVFMEIATIATIGLVLMVTEFKAFAAAFKYMMASGLISGFLLPGIIFLYNNTGTLNLAGLAAAQPAALKGGAVAVFLVMMAILLELKPFPANGWGIDLYGGAPTGVSAIISAASATATYYVLLKVLPLGGPFWFKIAAAVGIVTFVASNIMALTQGGARRILGYSSMGQVGLLVGVAGLAPLLGQWSQYIVFTLLVTHYLAKAGLFWLAGMVTDDKITGWAALRRSPVLLILFGVFLFALLGFPPFPSFFGKWQLILGLVSAKLYWWAGAILVGTLIEAVYLFRWFGHALKGDMAGTERPKVTVYKITPPLVAMLLLFPLGYVASTHVVGLEWFHFVPLGMALALALLEFLPAWTKNIITMGFMGSFIWYLWPMVYGNLFKMIFGAIFLGGGVLALFAGFYYKGRRTGFYPMALIMFAGLGIMLVAKNLLAFFYGWELMTVGSYFLLSRGEKSGPHGYRYMLFSLGGSLAMMFGFALAYASAGTIDMAALKGIKTLPLLAYSLMFIGFMTKTASLGFHIWLPGAHGEAKADVSFMASAILLKAGVFGMMLVLLSIDPKMPHARQLFYTLGWIGALTALIGNIGAVFQENAKHLLAWSSIGQLGYILFAMASMTHLGWLAAFGYTVAHFLYKGILFLVVGGIAMRTGTPEMYRMGGLIKRMPFSFVAVLISIITLAGDSPLVGFTGKWLFYNMVITHRMFYQGVVVLIAGIVAFLYLFRLIHVIFLGQLKDEHRKLKEISPWLLIPAYLMLGAIMAFSILPSTILRPLGEMLKTTFPTGALSWNGGTAVSALGTFNMQAIMYIIGAVFVTVFLFLVIANRRAQKVKQFNIFFSGEAPSRPELTHFGYNFFAHYKKAMGFMTVPLVTRFWNQAAEGFHALAAYGRAFHNGNGQSYLYHILTFVVVLYLATQGGLS